MDEFNPQIMTNLLINDMWMFEQKMSWDMNMELNCMNYLVKCYIFYINNSRNITYELYFIL